MCGDLEPSRTEKEGSVGRYTVAENLIIQFPASLARDMADIEGENDKEHPDNKKLSSEGWQSLRERKRHCTDCLCLVS